MNIFFKIGIIKLNNSCTQAAIHGNAQQLEVCAWTREPGQYVNVSTFSAAATEGTWVIARNFYACTDGRLLWPGRPSEGQVPTPNAS